MTGRHFCGVSYFLLSLTPTPAQNPQELFNLEVSFLHWSFHVSWDFFFFKLTPVWWRRAEGKAAGVGRSLGRSLGHRLPPTPQASSRINSKAECVGVHSNSPWRGDGSVVFQQQQQGWRGQDTAHTVTREFCTWQHGWGPPGTFTLTRNLNKCQRR